jgi:membrane protein implicated in regulation of membrane protease activity
MHLVALAWIYVVLMMALAEALSPQGTVLGAGITFLLYGVLPLSIVLYVMGTPMRRRARRRAEAQASAADPDSGGQAPGEAIATVRKEP